MSLRLSIATKIFLAFALVATTFSGVLMFGIWRTQALYAQVDAIHTHTVPVALLLSDIQTELKSIHALLHERDPVVLRRTLQVTRLVYVSLPRRLAERLDDARQMAGELPAGPADGGVAALKPGWARLERLAQQARGFAERSETFTARVLEERASGDAPEGWGEMQSELREEARALDNELAKLREDLRAAMERSLKQAHLAQRQALYALTAMGAVALLVATALLALILTTLRPLTQLTQAIRRVAQGDHRLLGPEEVRSGASDEIGLLVREFNAMLARLAERDGRLVTQHAALVQAERLATIGRMTSVITHELRNPLSSVSLNAEMLTDALVERGIDAQDPDVMPLLETIAEEVDRLREITEQYLDYARLPSPRPESEMAGELLAALVEFHQMEWSQGGVEVMLDHEGPERPVLLDAHQFRQAMLNLIKNAVEASPPSARVRVVVHGHEDRVEIAVQDNGPGIDAAARERIFEPFYTTKARGTGLGLSMTQYIVAQHGGSIDVDSGPSGTTFRLALPVSGPNRQDASCA